MQRRTLLTAALGAYASPLRAAAPLTLLTCSQQANVMKFDVAHAERPGICVDTLHAMGRADPDLHVNGLDVAMPLLRIENSLRDGTLDFFMGLLRTPEREAIMGFIDAPTIYEVHHGVAVRREDPIVLQGFDDIRALGDKGVIVVTRGTAYSSYLAQQGGLYVDDTGTSNEQNLKRVAAGRARFFYSAIATLQHYVDQLGLTQQLRVLPTVFKNDPQHIVYRRDLPQAAVTRLGNALGAVQRSGELAQLRARYQQD